MKSRIFSTILAGVAACVALSPSIAVRADSMPGMQMNKSAAAKAKGPVVKCAVTGEVIGAPSAAYASEKYKGKEYYFCCPKCKPLFDAHRAKYIKHGYAIPAAKTSKTAKHKA